MTISINEIVVPPLVSSGFAPCASDSGTQRLAVLFPRCAAAHAGRTRRSPRLVRLSRMSIADEMREEHRRRVHGD